MTRQRWIAFILCVTGLVLVADFYFLHVLFPLKKEALMREMNRGVEQSLTEKPPEEHPPAPAPAPAE